MTGCYEPVSPRPPPNADNAPFMADFPVEAAGGGREPRIVHAVWQERLEHDPLTMRVDCGTQNSLIE